MRILQNTRHVSLKLRQSRRLFCLPKHFSSQMIFPHRYIKEEAEDFSEQDETNDINKCTICNKEFDNATALERHKVWHGSLKVYAPGTSKSRKVKDNLSNASLAKFKKQNKMKKFLCDHCPKSFSSPSGLRYHKKALKRTQKYECALCNKEFCEKTILRHHMDIIHLNPQHEKKRSGRKPKNPEFHHAGPYICETCGASLKTKGSYERHQYVHTDVKDVACHVCGKMFACKQYLATHMLMHTKRGAYICKFCNKAYNSRTGLLYHRRYAHADVQEGNEASYHPRRRPKGKKNICADCGKSFLRKSQIEKHFVEDHLG